FTTSNTFEIALSAFAGQISTLTNIAIAPNGSSGPIGFTFGNLGNTAGAALQVQASSSNPALIPNSNLVLGGSGTSRTLTVTPVAGQMGSALITVSVTDGVWTNSRSFTASVSTFALAAAPPAQSIFAGQGTSYTVTVSAASGFAGELTLGLSGLPPGATAAFMPQSLTGPGDSTLNITTSDSVAPGSYPLTLTAVSGNLSNSTSAMLVVQTIAASPGSLVWNTGSSSATTNWSAPLNWTNSTAGGNGVPGVSNDVLFASAGATAGSNQVDNVVDVNTSINSLTFANTNGYHTTLIAPGKTLTVSGAKGILVGTETDLGTNVAVYASITGQGGALVLSNADANLLVRQYTAGTSGGIQRATLDLSGLDTFNATGNGIAVGNYAGNGTARSAGTLWLARTNWLNLTAPGRNVSTNAGIDLADNPQSNSSQFSFLFLGQANTIYADGLTVGGGRNIGWMGFNPNFTNSFLLLRGTNGDASRVSRWLVGDNAGASGTGSNSRGSNDFTGGTVDALVDTLILGRGENGKAGTGCSTGVVAFAQGTIDVNTLQMGVQYPGSSAGTNAVYVGQMDVNGNATLVVNSTLVMTSQAVAAGMALQAVLNLNGGTVQAAGITNGGGTAIIALNSGLLDLQGGRIANASTLTVGAAGESEPAQLLNATAISSANPIAIASNGVVAGNASITAPQLAIQGTLSPGSEGIGALTNSGTLTLGGGGRYAWHIQDATGSPGVAWDFLQNGGVLDVQATSANRFVLQVRSLGDPLQGLPHFNDNIAYVWPMASGSGVANFAASSFAVDDNAFEDDLAGGYFSVITNANALALAFDPNHPPVAADVSYYCSPGGGLTIPVAALAAHWSDPDGDPVQLLSVSRNSAQASDNVAADSLYIYYTNAAHLPDTLTYTVTDVRTSPPAIYRPGDTVRTDSGLIQVLPLPSLAAAAEAGGQLVFSGANGQPGATFRLLSSTNLTLPLSDWTPLATNQFDSQGNFVYTNTLSPAQPQQFYRLILDF
ncbi:MAG: beta strand repeat-containing protein, partial [Verrucomicrobiota bacterium]